MTVGLGCQLGCIKRCLRPVNHTHGAMGAIPKVSDTWDSYQEKKEGRGQGCMHARAFPVSLCVRGRRYSAHIRLQLLWPLDNVD